MTALARLKMLLWLLAAFTLTKQDMVRLHVTPDVRAECGEPVTLPCNVSTLRNGLKIKQLEWMEDNKILCELNGKENVTEYANGERGFHCEYTERQLTLVLHQVWPLDAMGSKRFMCKLRSNQGILHGRSRIHLQECCGSVEEGENGNGPFCKFNHVYPDADAFWFNESHGPLKHKVYKNVDGKGWTTITSELQESSDVTPNCSLRNPESGRHITCTEFRQPPPRTALNQDPVTTPKNGHAALGPFGLVLYIALSLSATM